MVAVLGGMKVCTMFGGDYMSCKDIAPLRGCIHGGRLGTLKSLSCSVRQSVSLGGV